MACSPHGRPPSQRPVRRVGPGAGALLAAVLGAPAVAGAPDGRGRRAGQPLDALGAVLALASHDDDRAVPARPRGRTTTWSFPWHRSLDTAIPTVGSVMGDGGYRSSYIGKWHLTGGPTPPMEPVRVRGLGRQRPALHGLGRHRRALRPGHRRLGGPLARGERRGGGPPWFLTVALVNPHDVMWFPMDQPAYQASHRRRAGRHGGPARCGQVEGRRRRAALHRALRGRGRLAARQLRRRPPDQARLPPPVALGPAALDRRATSTPRTGRAGCASWTTTCASTSWPTSRSARCSARWSAPGRGTTPSSSSRPTTVTCAVRTACARRARSSTTRSCGCRAT